METKHMCTICDLIVESRDAVDCTVFANVVRVAHATCVDKLLDRLIAHYDSLIGEP